MSVGDRLPQLGLLDGYTRAERGVVGFVVLLMLLLTYGLVTGGLGPTYFLYLIGLVGMYVLLSFGLNAQWGYTGLINFSVAAFFGIGAYGTALLSADSSPIAGDMLPVVGLFVGLLVAAIVAVVIGIPTLRLRTDYLAIASLGLAEVIRILVQNQRDYTNGSAGLRGIPGFFEGWPVLETFPQAMPTLIVERLVVTIPFVAEFGLFGFRLGPGFWQGLLNVSLVLVFVGVTYAMLRRVHRSPWGRVLRTIRADEDLAEALGKNTYAFKMQSFVLGSVIMALAGVFYAHLNLYVSPGDFEPINTFYVWIAVILGGSGSNRGAMFGGFVVIAIREGTRFLGDLLPAAFPTLGVPFTDLVVSFPALVENTYATVVSNFASTRLLAVGLIIILVMRFRPEGVLPPQRELIWPAATEGSDPGSEPGARAVSTDGSGANRGGETNE
ncbi:branched-chain amino acid ABC transporter permease [Salinirubellus salinus]|uniref:Branched-chain amino acid ABC transporter permease n=1 Tax=Salinirubellus salinus TaxID=1364945 RepID=A0A9E7R0X1_9EURY|nr:branched-chain amino acid ABC transporter permease [Salinirubellus salinus]UWM52868.1 branched-chain amino acid ABC transporter permease [Salinirubellus salinus]